MRDATHGQAQTITADRRGHRRDRLGDARGRRRPRGEPVAGSPPAGPPYPEPVEDQAVYDYAGVLRPETVAQAEQIIDAIEAQTGVEVVVYTQAMGRDDLTTPEAEADAAALMDEWGIGRAGVDDGLVMLVELGTSPADWQVQLYAGDGFENAYLTTAERQAIFDDEMAPLIRDGDLDNAILVALGHVLSATFARAQRIRARKRRRVRRSPTRRWTARCTTSRAS